MKIRYARTLKKRRHREVEAEKNHFFIIIFYDGNKYIYLFTCDKVSDECVSTKLGVTENFVSSLYLLIYLFMLQSGIFRINRTGVGDLSETVALPYLLGMVL